MDDEDTRAVMQICSFLKDLEAKYGRVMSGRELTLIETARSGLAVFVQYMDARGERAGAA